MQAALIGLLFAFAVDILFGDPPNRFHPVVLMGNFIRETTRKWNHGGASRRFWAGLAMVVCGGALFSLPWLAVRMGLSGLPVWAQGILIGLLVKPVFAFRGLLKAGREVRAALDKGDLGEARRLVSWSLVSRDTSALSDRQVAAATIESLAENLTDSFFSPLLFFAIGGLPLAWFYRFANTCDSMIGYHTDEYEYFGKFAARLDDVLNYVPARIAGFLLVLSAALSGCDVKNALRVMLDQHGRTSSPNAGWTMSAGAGALGVVLEKVDHYRLEGGKDLPTAQDIGRAVRLVSVALVVGLAFCAGVIAVAGGL